MKLKYYVVMLRPVNSALSGFGAVFAVLVYSNYVVSNPLLLLVAFTTGFTLTGAAMVVNDVVDLEVDRVNKPWKPLPSGKASTEVATVLAILLFTTGVLCNTPVSPVVLAVALLYGLVGVGYSFLRRYWWSSTLVAASTTGPVVYGYVVSNTPQRDLLFTLLFSATVFTVTLGREFLKSIQDYSGDLRQGYRTVATVYGLSKARKAMLVTGLLGSTLGFSTLLVPAVSTVYRAFISIAAAVYATSIVNTYRDSTPENLEKYRRRTLQAMILGTVAFWLSKIPV